MQIDRQTDKQKKDTQTSIQANKQTHKKHLDRHTYKTERHTYILTERQTNRQPHILTD